MLALAFVIPVGLYLATLPPSITWWFAASDSGDLISAADTLGIPHPTGYPLFVLLGFIATRFPLGEVAARVNVLNALLGGAGALGIAVTASVLTARGRAGRYRDGAALIAALAVATSSLYWSQAIVGEVHALQCALTALVVSTWAREGTHPLVRGTAHGLALTNHLTAVILVLAAVPAALRTPREAWSLRASLWFVAGLTAPLLLYLLLPLRAHGDAVANWGDPDTPWRFFAHVTGRQYGYLVGWRDVPGAMQALPALVRLLVEDVPIWIWPTAAIGYVHLLDVRRQFAHFTGLACAGTLLFTTLYQAADRVPYLLPAYVIVGVWSAVGLVRCIAWLRQRTVAGMPPYVLPLAAAGLLMVSTLWAARAYGRVNLSGDDSAVVLARAVLMELPPGATYATARDDITFALWYAQRSLNLRPDVRVIDLRNPSLRSLP